MIILVNWWIYVLIAIAFIIYIGMIVIVIRAPVFDLKDITEDDEYAKEDAAKIVYSTIFNIFRSSMILTQPRASDFHFLSDHSLPQPVSSNQLN